MISLNKWQNLNKKKNFRQKRNHRLNQNHNYTEFQLKVGIKKENLQKSQKFKVL